MTQNSQKDPFLPPIIKAELRPSGRISVIIPTFNYARFIGQCIESVLSQGVEDKEIIVVDDGSTDDTWDVLEPYMNQIRYLRQENQGLPAARNTGIASSTGDFFLFLDSDDILGPDTLASQLNFLQNNPGVSVAVCRNRIFHETEANGRPLAQGEWPLYQSDLDIHLCHLNIAPPHAFLITGKAAQETGLFDPRLKACEDYDFWIRAAMKGFIPQFNPKGLVFYRNHKNSMSANLTNQYQYDKILCERLSALLEKYPNYPLGRRFEGLLAFSSGALFTAVHLDQLQLDGGESLLNLAMKWIREAGKIKPHRNRRWNPLIRLFTFRIIHHLQSTKLLHPEASESIQENLVRALRNARLPASGFLLKADAIRSCWWKSFMYTQEIVELRDLVREQIAPYDFLLGSPQV